MSNYLAYESNRTRKRLLFGIPLNSAFPLGEVHSSLKNAFKLCYDIAFNSGYTVTELLGPNFQGTLEQRLALKEEFVLSKSHLRRDIPPGAVLWVIRHYIGLLPTSLMPRAIEDQKYVWRALSYKCRKHLANYYCSGEDDAGILVRQLSTELLRLPPENFVLLATFFNFMRILSVLPQEEPDFNKESALALVRYFSSSLLIRPFRPGCTTKTEKLYYPLVFYMILEWKMIRSFCVRNGNYTFESSLTSSKMTPIGLSKESLKSENYIFETSLSKTSLQRIPMPTLTETKPSVVNRTADSSTQTPGKETEYLVRAVPRSYYDFDFLKDVGCQATDISSEQFERDNCCCCRLGNHYEKSPNQECELLFQLPNCDKNLQASSFDLITSDTLESPTYMYDNYSKCDLLSSSEYETIRAFDPIQKIDTPLKELSRSEIGWLYSSSPYHTLNTSLQASSTIENKQSTPVGWNIPSQNAYQLCYGVQKLLNDELKLKFKEMRIGSEPEDDSTINNITPDNKKKSLGSITTIKSKLEFLRIFNSKKARKSYSCEQISSKVKYERMGSISSFL